MRKIFFVISYIMLMLSISILIYGGVAYMLLHSDTLGLWFLLCLAIHILTRVLTKSEDKD